MAFNPRSSVHRLRGTGRVRGTRLRYGLAEVTPSNVPPPTPSGYGPPAAAVPGLTLAWDFDMAGESLGAMRAEIPSRAGTATGAFMHPMSGGISVVTVSGTRRALRFDASASAFARVLDGMAVLNEANADFTMVFIGARNAGSADHTFWHLHAGYLGGTDSEIVNTHRLMATSANAVQYLRNGASGSTTAGLGTLATGAMRAITRANLSGDNIGRGMLNGGAKAQTAVRNISQAEFAEFLIGAQAIWRSGTSGYPEYIKHGAIDVERILLYAGAAADADLDVLNTWALAGYP